MSKIVENFNIQKDITSDINEHIETLREYGEMCPHITEMGVRWVSSTWAFLMTHPVKLISYDIVRDNNVNYVELAAAESLIDYKFIQADVLCVDIEKTDLLFIDTLHTYNQLFAELNRHSINVSKFIILHDTSTFGKDDERIYGHASELVKGMDVNKTGLLTAIEDFLSSDIGSDWFISRTYDNNNGLTILSRR